MPLTNPTPWKVVRSRKAKHAQACFIVDANGVYVAKTYGHDEGNDAQDAARRIVRAVGPHHVQKITHAAALLHAAQEAESRYTGGDRPTEEMLGDAIGSAQVELETAVQQLIHRRIP